MRTKKASKKGAGGNLNRSETVTIRLDPKLRYLTEIGARCQRRTVSSFIEWAVQQSLSMVMVTEGGLWSKRDTPLITQSELLWKVHEADRFAYLAILRVELLNTREQMLFQLLKDRGLMNGIFPSDEDYDLEKTIHSQIHWKRVEQELVPSLRKHWEEFNEVIDGKRDANELPFWD